MSNETLLKIVGGAESLNIEWKLSLSQINEIIETISGFSNSEGGKVIIGVYKSGKPRGVEIGKDTIEQLTNLPVGRQVKSLRIPTPGFIPA